MEQEYRESIKGRIIFGISTASRFIQDLIAEIFSILLIKPCLRLIRTERETKDGKKVLYQFNCARTSHRFLFSYWKVAMKIQMSISGLKGGKQAYHSLLNWDLGIPIIGFDRGKNAPTIEMLTPRMKDPLTGEESQYWDAFWQTRPEVSGKVKILRRTISPTSNEIEILGVWKTGKFAGKTFSISSSSGALPESVEGNDFRPTNIYVAPALLIWAVTLSIVLWQVGIWAASHLPK